jgi:NitT/TauT family transport system substrate-binding protein
MTEPRLKASYDFLVTSKLIDPSKVELAKTYTTEFVKDIKVLP